MVLIRFDGVSLKTVVIVSDLHCGHVKGLMPESVRKVDGNVVYPNALQMELLDAWKEVVDSWRQPDALVVNGDALDGVAPSHATELWTSDLHDQVVCASELLDMFEAKRYFFTAGTPYHTSLEGQKSEQMLASIYHTNVYDEISLQVDDVKLHFAHHIPVSSTMYKTTAIARELAMLGFNQEDLMRYDWVFRSHSHYFVHIEYGHTHGVVTPCWQLQTGFMVRKSVFGLLPKIGALRLSIEGDQVNFEKMLFKFSKRESDAGSTLFRI
ncbi:MAG: hypothetical protein ACXQTL_02285 [Methanosarcinales archaeon]